VVEVAVTDEGEIETGEIAVLLELTEVGAEAGVSHYSWISRAAHSEMISPVAKSSVARTAPYGRGTCE
jgi:hypothetical protein